MSAAPDFASLGRVLDAIRAAQERRAPEATWQVYRSRLPTYARGAATWRVVRELGDGCAWRGRAGHLRVLETISREADGRVWHHVSVSRRDRCPTWAEVADVKNTFCGADREAYVVLPPAARYVNLHPTCLHLWSCLDGAGAAPDGAILPDFTGGTGSI